MIEKSANGTETVILALGGNVGDPRGNILRAAELLRAGGVDIYLVSSFFRTSPVGVLDQPEFFNAAVAAHTALEPAPLLAKIKEIEESLGRNLRGPRWGPRPVDIDIIFFGRRLVRESNLTIPHPRFSDRLFVLEPILEIAPDFQLPNGEAFHDFYRRRRDSLDFSLQSVEKLP